MLIIKKNMQVISDSFGTANCMLFKIEREIEQVRFSLLSDWYLARVAGPVLS